MRILVTGATGFIGRKISERVVAAGDELVALMRDPIHARETLPPPYDAYAWDMMAGPPFEQALTGANWVFHLAGEPVGEGRWTSGRKRRILESRVLGTRHLIEAIRKMKGPRPSVLVAASAVGFYGNRGDEILDEDSPPGTGFLPGVCTEWEREAFVARELGLRVVTLRIGFVLGKGGGALSKLIPIFRSGMGGPAGSGRQWVSWIHIDDVAALFEFSARVPDLSGPLNAVAPHPVTQAEFAGTLAAELGKPAWLATPAFALKLGLGEMSELVLSSQRVSSAKARGLGYEFKYTELEAALRDAVTGSP